MYLIVLFASNCTITAIIYVRNIKNTFRAKRKRLVMEMQPVLVDPLNPSLLEQISPIEKNYRKCHWTRNLSSEILFNHAHSLISPAKYIRLL